MKVVILVGGFGTRIFEESVNKPKPMVEIGEKPIIWHIMKYYSTFGFNEFILCLGYKKDFIINYFDSDKEYKTIHRDLTINQSYFTYCNINENWDITLVDTGFDTMTGGRLKHIKPLLNNETFLLTYGDTLSNIDISKLLKFHKDHKVLATLTTVHPVSNYGVLSFDENQILVSSFIEKPLETSKWINAGFYVIEPEVINFIDDDKTSFEKEPIKKIVELKKLAAFKHTGFWISIETLKDKITMNNLWESSTAPWKIWDKN
jgi:glucose-1-phosphate cytidylyltransferase